MINEHKKGVRAMKYTKKAKGIDAPKPRNFVAKNQPTTGAGAHKDKKKAAKQGDVKHKAKSLDIAESTNPEYNDEAGMSRGSLLTIHRAAVGLMDVIKEGDNLPEWCQEKISLAEDYLVTVWDYIQSEKEQGVAEGTENLSIGQQMARDGITYSPEKENELISLMAQYMKKAGMSSKAIRYYLSYDEDFIPDQLSDLPRQNVAEEWSQKYKNSINCSHPKGFSQRAHCQGKKKHNESTEMEMVCPDCGMCETHGNVKEGLRNPKDNPCWKGYHPVGTKKKGGRTVPNCVPKESVKESNWYELRLKTMLNEARKK